MPEIRIDVRRTIEDTLPGGLKVHAIGWDNDISCAQLRDKLVTGVLALAPDLQEHIERQLVTIKATRKRHTIHVHIQRVSMLVAVFARMLREEIELALNVGPGQLIKCEAAIEQNDCIARAGARAVQEFRTAKKGNNSSKRRKYQTGYPFRAA